MVIAWIYNNVSDSIKNSILFVNNASDAWKILEKRFQVVNGSRKYKLCRDLFNLKQNGVSLLEYYTAMSIIWSELEDMNALPVITTLTDEIRVLMKTLDVRKQEAKLFQFLNGLDDEYGAHRSQLLMMDPFPSVEMACSVIQQEETQRETLKMTVGQSSEIAVMYSKGGNHGNSNGSGSSERCIECGGRGHSKDNYWTIIGYPKWHNTYRKNFTSKIGNVSGRWQSGRSNNRRMENSTSV
ncbi:uncharacterized protein LOC141702720 [Apium graveolens]|uniref:uncharacterized protein LOC141702718 n=1 Tax=Apium graveolens TaxID=4045 RepID=UPI003D7A2D32